MIYFGREYCTAKLHTVMIDSYLVPHFLKIFYSMIIRFNNLKYCFCNLQPKECPICSWVNKKDGQPAISFIDFTPKKKSKGIVFYEDRMIELEESPHLARGAVLLTAVKLEANEEQLPSSLLEDLLSPLKKGKKTRRTKVVSIITPDIKIKTEVDVEVDVEGSAASGSGSSSKKKIKMEYKDLDFSSPVVAKRKRTAPVLRNMLETPRPKERSVAEVPEQCTPAEDCMTRIVCAPGLESNELLQKDEECSHADGQLSSGAAEGEGVTVTGLPPVTAVVEMLHQIEKVVDEDDIAMTADKRILQCKLESAAAIATVTEAVTAVAADSVKMEVEVKVDEVANSGLSRALTRSRSKRKSIE